MPTYRVTDPDTGTTLRLTGDSPPSEQELNEIFSSVSSQNVQNPGVQQPQEQIQEEELSTIFSDPVETFKRSGGEFARGIKEAVTHPVQTGKALGGLALGAAQKLIPGEQKHEKMADALGQHYIERYGSLENAKQTAITDPVGFLSDLSIFMTGGGAAVGKVGKVAKISKVAKTGEKLSKIGKVIDPLAITTKSAGGAVKSLTKGKTIGVNTKAVDSSIAETAKKLGVDLPASAKTSSRVVPIAEGITAKGLFGGKLVSKVDNAKAKLVQIADDTIKDIGRSSDMGSAGTAISEGTARFRQNFFDLKNALYEKAGFAEKGKSVSFTPQTNESLRVVQEIVQIKKDAGKLFKNPKSKAMFEKLERALKGETKIKKSKVLNAKGQPAFQTKETRILNAREVKAALDELNEGLFTSSDPVITGNRAKLSKVAATLSDELDEVIKTQNPQLYDDIQKANDVFKRGLEELNSHFGKQIIKNADKPDKILPAIINKSNSVEDIERIYNMIGADNVPTVQAAFLDDFFSKAKSNDIFTPQGISKQIKAFGEEKLARVLTPEQFQKVKDLDKLSRSLGKLDKVTAGSQTAFSNRLVGELMLSFVNQPLAIKVFIGDVAFSNFVNSKIGQAFLTDGVRLKGAIGQGIINSADFAGELGRAARVGDIISDRSDSF